MDTIAALFVRHDGVYTGLPGLDPELQGVDPWCQRRDARNYGCFAAALQAVRRWGGVLEHPAFSLAWKAFELPSPERDSMWTVADAHGGRSIDVDQGHYGHRAQKRTWLYAVAPELPDLVRGPSEASAWLMQPGRCSKGRPRPTCPCEKCEEHFGDDWRGAHNRRVPRLTKRQNEATPIAFRNVLLSIARSAVP